MREGSKPISVEPSGEGVKNKNTIAKEVLGNIERAAEEQGGLADVLEPGITDATSEEIEGAVNIAEEKGPTVEQTNREKEVGEALKKAFDAADKPLN